MDFLSRTELLVGNDGIKKLNKSNIILFGCGGVGGYVAEMLVRSGIGKITIVDFDKIDVSNINRQVIALHSNIGKYKVDVLKERLLDINPMCDVTALNIRYQKQCKILNNDFDFVIDAIDSVKDKVDLICEAHNLNLNIVSAMGAGNRCDIPEFVVEDIFKTYNDGLAKVVRKKLRENNINKHTCVFTKSLPQNIEQNTIGSIAYYPAMCGCVISSYVINKILKGD